MEPTKQTVYLPVKEETEYTTPSWSGDLEQNEGYFFTPEQLNEYTANVIRKSLETAAENAETKTEEVYAGSLGNEFGKLYNEISIIDKQSITDTFDQTYKEFEV